MKETQPLTDRQRQVLEFKRVFKTRAGFRLQPENETFASIAVAAPARAGDDEPAPDFRSAGPVVGVVRTVEA